MLHGGLLALGDDLFEKIRLNVIDELRLKPTYGEVYFSRSQCLELRVSMMT